MRAGLGSKAVRLTSARNIKDKTRGSGGSFRVCPRAENFIIPIAVHIKILKRPISAAKIRAVQRCAPSDAIRRTLPQHHEQMGSPLRAFIVNSRYSTFAAHP